MSVAADSAETTLRRLEERLNGASEAAERLFAQAAADAAARLEGQGARRPPASGWQSPSADPDASEPSGIESLLALWDSVADLVPPELRRRLADAVRELLLALRALIDWCLERAERERTEPVEVHDIPIV